MSHHNYSTLQVVADRDGILWSAFEIEATVTFYGDPAIRLLGSCHWLDAIVIPLSRVHRIFPVMTGPDLCGSLAEWAEGTDYRLAGPDDETPHADRCPLCGARGNAEDRDHRGCNIAVLTARDAHGVDICYAMGTD